MPDVRNGILRGQLARLAVDRKHQRAQRVIALRMLDRILPPGKLFPPRLQIRPLIFQSRKPVIIHSIFISLIYIIPL